MDTSLLSPEKKKEIFSVLADAMISQMEMGELSMEDVNTLSNEVLSEMEKVNTDTELQQFLTRLSEKWPFYQEITSTFSNEISTGDDTTSANKIKEELAQL